MHTLVTLESEHKMHTVVTLDSEHKMHTVVTLESEHKMHTVVTLESEHVFSPPGAQAQGDVDVGAVLAQARALPPPSSY